MDPRGERLRPAFSRTLPSALAPPAKLRLERHLGALKGVQGSEMDRSASVSELDKRPLRSRPRHLGLKQLDITDQKWYERKQIAKQPRGAVAVLLQPSPSDAALARPVAGAAWVGRRRRPEACFGARDDRGAAGLRAPRVLPRAVLARVDAMGNWPLPDTPRCAAVALAAEAYALAMEARRVRLDEISRRYQEKMDAAAAAASDAAGTAGGGDAGDAGPDGDASRLASGGEGHLPKRRKLRLLLRRAMMLNQALAGFPVPDRASRKALLEIKAMLAEDAHRTALFEWPTLLKLFRVDEATELKQVNWPISAEAPRPLEAPAYPRGVFDSGAPAAAIRLRTLAQLLRYVGLTDQNVIRLLEARLGEKMDGCCTRDADGDGEDDGEWSPEPKFYELRDRGAPSDDEDQGDSPAERVKQRARFRQGSLLRFEAFKEAMWPTESELRKIRQYYAAVAKKQAAEQAARDKKNAARAAQQRERRSGALRELMLALDEWPPAVRRHQPKFTTASRRAALEFVCEAGANGKKAGFLAAAAASSSHVKLRAPGMRQCLINCCLTGSGYGGLSAVEIVETFYQYCAERLQAAWRGKKGGAKFAKARALWKRRDHGVLRRVILAWAADAKHVADLRRRCLRKVVAWRRETREGLRKKELFRQCFWPMRVWRKVARANFVAREKGKFLRLIWKCLLKKRHLKAWRKLAAQRARRKLVSDTHAHSWLRRRHLAKPWVAWISRARQRRALRKAWTARPKGGQMLLRRMKRARAGRALAVWKYYVCLAKLCRVRAASWFRRLKADDDNRGRLEREAKRVRGTKRRSLTKDIEAFEANRMRPPPLPAPDDAACFALPPPASPEEGAAAEAPPAEPPAEPANDNDSDDGTVSVDWGDGESETSSMCGSVGGSERKPKRKSDQPKDLVKKGTKGRRKTRKRAVKVLEVAGPRSTLSSDERLLCEPLALYFEAKVFPRELAACWMRYWRFGPLAFSALGDFALEQRKAHRADLLFAWTLKRRSFRLWIVAWRETVSYDADSNFSYDSYDTASATGSATAASAQTGAPPQKRRKRRSKADFDPYAQDRGERAQQAARVAASLAQLRGLAAEVRAACAAERAVDGEREGRGKQAAAHVGAFLSEQDAAAAVARDRAVEYVEGFFEHAARKLLDAAYRIRKEVVASYDRDLAKSALRALRLPWAMRKTAALLRRQILRRRLAICVRLRQIERGMPKYHRLRTKWLAWQSWLTLAANHEAWRSPGLAAHLAHRQRRAERVSALLRARAPRDDAASGTDGRRWRRFAQCSPAEFADVPACFLRWSAYAQEKVRFGLFSAAVRARRALRLQHQVFAALRDEAGISVRGARDAQAPPATFAATHRVSAALRRCDADVQTWRARFVASRRSRDAILRFRRINAVKARAVADRARCGMSFKRLLVSLRAEVDERLHLEQKLLLADFKARGDAVIKDVDTEIAAPGAWAALAADAKAFRDARCPGTSRIGCVNVVTQRGRGVVGLGLVLDSDGEKLSLHVHGSDEGVGQAFEFESPEALTGVEVLVGNSVIEAVRFEVSVLGNAAMVGRSRARMAVYGGVAETTVRLSKWFGAALSENSVPRMLRGDAGSCVVGLFGDASPTRVLRLGLVSRSLKNDGVFNFYWPPPLKSHADLAAHAAAALQAAAEDDASIQLLDAPPTPPATNEGDEAQVVEMATVLRYRRADGLGAAQRAEAFARRAWYSRRLCAEHPDVEPLCRLPIVVGLARWLFSALAAPLVPLAPDGGAANAALREAEAQMLQGKARRARAAQLRDIVAERRRDHAARARQARLGGSSAADALARIGPKFRAAEAKRLLIDDADAAAAAADHAAASGAMRCAADAADAARGAMPRIDPKAPRVRSCYARLVALARQQRQLEQTFDAENFHAALKGAADAPGGALGGKAFENVLEIVHRRRETETAPPRGPPTDAGSAHTEERTDDAS
ncbi:hypothetical protein M885DRAFT_611069 [Pelagophyceae sp. CCMP2097]|nr:hypothetical protein M885DRAFT_611069 [Pelagophyceae sp. CCMP2097]